MANLTKDTSNNLWPVPITVAGVGTTTHILQTENKFVDANISIKVTTPAASGASLTITDKATTNVSVGTVSNGYYPLTTSLTGKLTVSTPGWLTTAGLSATDDTVIVGRIIQSTLKNGNTAISSGDTITPNVSSTQTINITEGYEGARTVIIGAMSSGTQAVASVSATKQASQPTLANTESALNGKTQVTASPVTGTSDINKYYLAMTATAPATQFATSNITKTVSTAGYLGSANQINIANNTGIQTTANTNLYYVPLTTGAITVSGSTVATTPTATNSSATISGKTKITVTPTTATDTVSTYYMALTVNAPATNVSLTANVTPGYIGSSSEVTASGSTTAKSSTYYIPVTSGALSSGAGAAAASSSNVSLTNSSTQPESGFYITVTGSGTVSVGTTGWLASGTSKTSNTHTTYYTIPAATFTVAGNVIKSSTAGYIAANTQVGTVSEGSLANTATSGVSYAEVTAPVLSANGYLYINAGYFSNKKISLATLIPDDSNYTNAATNKILKNYEAYDSDGNKLIGTIETYQGEYTVA